MELEIAALYKAVRARLTAAAPPWGTRAYAEIAPAAAPLPYLVYTVTGRDALPNGESSADRGAVALTLRVLCIADGVAASLNVSAAAAALLDDADAGTADALDGGADWTIRACTRIETARVTRLIDGTPQPEAALIYRVLIEPKTPPQRTGRAVRFGAYTFPTSTLRLTDNFAAFTPLETALPGLNGALVEGGSAPAGRVEIACWLPVGDVNGRDALNAIIGWGAQDLVIAPGSGLAQRVTRARALRIEHPAAAADRPDLGGVVRIAFAAEQPRWFSAAAPAESGVQAACSGISTDFTRTVGGNLPAAPLISVIAALPISGFTLERRVGGAAADRIVYAAAVPGGSIVRIDTAALDVTINGAPAYSSAFSADHPDWFRLLPGANTIRVVLAAAESAAVVLTWADTWA
ncbi:MAG: hypothetical protein SF162_17090 [bacterium]|nr:hypothetical protein [bacterium]